MRKKIVAGNWKMNKNLQEGVALATELKDILAAEKPNCEVIIGTPFIHLATVSELLKDSVIAVSAENCANHESGAYTGEVSAAMVKSTGAEYVILGHSERREYYAETPEILKEKVDLALANGLKVIFCIGESLAQREANEQEAVCKAELAGSVFHLTAEQWKDIVIAYEPIWAIGTGKTATAEQAEEIHAYIRKCVAEVYGEAVADETSILYGGSCKASNAPELWYRVILPCPSTQHQPCRYSGSHAACRRPARPFTVNHKTCAYPLSYSPCLPASRSWPSSVIPTCCRGLWRGRAR